MSYNDTFVPTRAAMVSTDDAAPAAVQTTLPVGVVNCCGFSLARIRFLAGADGQAYTATLYGVDKETYRSSSRATEDDLSIYHFTTIGTNTSITGGTLAVPTGPFAGSVYCDTAAFTVGAMLPELQRAMFPTSAGAVLTTDSGSVVGFSPTSNLVGEWLFNGCGAFWGFYVRISALSSETANVLVQLTNPRG